MFKKIALTLSLIAASLPLAAESTHLLDIYRLALERDPQLAIAAEGLQAKLELRPQARSALLPTVGLGASLGRQFLCGSNSSSPCNSNYALSLSLKQGIYHRDAFILADESEVTIRQAESEYAAAAQAVILRVTSAYFDLLAAQDSLTLAEAEKRAISQQLNQTKQRHQVGLSAITDVHEAQAGYDLISAQVIAAKSGVDVAREALYEIIDQSPGSVALLGAEIPLESPDPEDIEAWVEAGLKENLSLQAMRLKSEVMTLTRERVAAGHYPSVDLVANLSRSDSDMSAESDNGSVGLQLELPLYTGGYTSSKVREAGYLLAQIQSQLEQQQRATVRAIRSAYLAVTTGISQVLAQKQAVASAKVAMEATQAGFEVGTRTTVDLLNSQKDLFRGERDLAKSRYDYLLATLSLKQAAGSLRGEDLNAINQLLQP
ncbi:MAG: TolC family outer membrane protein [Gammaproteobacteria bacterium]|nr:TolC family outer membrane protein [Gammaproteobacteria bacterium]